MIHEDLMAPGGNAMPNKDGTGPSGQGAMTGGCRGDCILPLSTPAEELDFLNKRAKALQAELKYIRTRINGVKTK